MTFIEWFGLTLAAAIVVGFILIGLCILKGSDDDPWYSDMT